MSASDREWFFPLYRVNYRDRWLTQALDGFNELSLRMMLHSDEGQGVYNFVENSEVIWRV